MAKEKKKPVRNGVLRLVLVLLAAIIEITFIILLLTYLSGYAEWVSLVIRVLTTLLVLGIFSRDRNSAINMPWIVLIMALPVVGVTIYLMIGFAFSTRRMSSRYRGLEERLRPFLRDDPAAEAELRSLRPTLAALARYLRTTAGYPIAKGGSVKYFSTAEAALEAQLEDLRSAEKFIFMDYYAIEDGESFQVIVVYESAPVLYKSDGTPYADWSAKLIETTTAKGGRS